MNTARQRCVNLLDNGAAYERWCRMVQGQGGNPEALLAVAPASELTANPAGVVSAIDTEALGLVIISLGGGRRKMGDPIDHSVGLEMFDAFTEFLVLRTQFDASGHAADSIFLECLPCAPKGDAKAFVEALDLRIGSNDLQYRHLKCDRYYLRGNVQKLNIPPGTPFNGF